MIEQDATVIQILPDLDPQGNIMGYQVALAFKIPAAKETAVWKHVLHVIVPKEQWHDQYKMGQDYHVTLTDTGEITVKRLV